NAFPRPVAKPCAAVLGVCGTAVLRGEVLRWGRLSGALLRRQSRRVPPPGGTGNRRVAALGQLLAGVGGGGAQRLDQRGVLAPPAHPAEAMPLLPLGIGRFHPTAAAA